MRGSRVTYPVSFDIRQLTRGELVVGTLSRTVIDLELEDWLNISMVGYVSDPANHWVVVQGMLPVMQEPANPGITPFAFGARRVILVPRGWSALSESFDFLIVNFNIGEWDRPIDFVMPGWGITLEPLESYDSTSFRLVYFGGVEPTAICTLRPVNGKAKPNEAERIVKDVCVALSLATGTKVGWLEFGGDAPIWIAQHLTNAGFRSAIAENKWQLDTIAAVTGWRENGSDYVRGLIDFLIESLSNEVGIEAELLMLATLIDGASSYHASNSQHSGVRSFRTRLEWILHDYGLPKTNVVDVVKLRNELVHQGRLPSEWTPIEAERLLIGHAHAIIARMAGYAGPMHSMS